MKLWSLWRHKDWRPVFVVRERTLSDGKRAAGHLMRRWTAGKWEYRQATPEEVLAEMQSSSW